MLVGNFEFNPKGDQSERGLSFSGPLKDTSSKQFKTLYFHICAVCNPKQDLGS